MTNGYVDLCALVRAACLRLTMDGARSSLGRGYNSMFASSGGSSLWCETLDSRRWSITLGVGKLDDSIAADWRIDIAWGPEGHVTVCTPSYLTQDGALANAELHDALRDQLLDAFAVGDGEAGELESDLTQAATGWLCRLPDRTQGMAAGPLHIRTRLSLDQVGTELADVALPLLAHSRDRWLWTLGLGDGTLELAASTHGEVTTLQGEIAIKEGLSQVRRVTAQKAARTWCRYAEGYLKARDPDVHFEPSTGRAGTR